MADPLAPEAADAEPLAGADVGATLVKLALRDPGGDTRLETHPIQELDEVAKRLRRAGGRRIGITGGGAPQLERLLQVDPAADPPAHASRMDTARVGEFAAWSIGARRMLRGREADLTRFLLVSVGTGTSAMLVDGPAVTRVGGTALGGGTIMGLGVALTGQREFDAIAEAAARGNRRNVDLLIQDVYPEGDFLLPGEINASSFARLARLPEGDAAAHSDLAHGVMGLVGENVALICCGLAAATKVERIVWGGTTLRNNPSLVAVLAGACRALGRQPMFLPKGEFVGALGALEWAAGDTTT